MIPRPCVSPGVHSSTLLQLQYAKPRFNLKYHCRGENIALCSAVDWMRNQFCLFWLLTDRIKIDITNDG